VSLNRSALESMHPLRMPPNLFGGGCHRSDLLDFVRVTDKYDSVSRFLAILDVPRDPLCRIPKYWMEK
jgi:hypothetical protein